MHVIPLVLVFWIMIQLLRNVRGDANVRQVKEFYDKRGFLRVETLSPSCGASAVCGACNSNRSSHQNRVLPVRAKGPQRDPTKVFDILENALELDEQRGASRRQRAKRVWYHLLSLSLIHI